MRPTSAIVLRHLQARYAVISRLQDLGPLPVSTLVCQPFPACAVPELSLWFVMLETTASPRCPFLHGVAPLRLHPPPGVVHAWLLGEPVLHHHPRQAQAARLGLGLAEFWRCSEPGPWTDAAVLSVLPTGYRQSATSRPPRRGPVGHALSRCCAAPAPPVPHEGMFIHAAGADMAGIDAENGGGSHCWLE